MSQQIKYIEAPIVSISNYCPNGEEKLIIHNLINLKGKMVLNKPEAALLLIELYKFINSEGG